MNGPTVPSYDAHDDSPVPQVYGARDVAQQRVKSLKELTWAKANVLLSTAYGQKAMHGVDSGASYAMQLLDHYLPPTPEEISGKCQHAASMHVNCRQSALCWPLSGCSILFYITFANKDTSFACKRSTCSRQTM